MVKTSDFLAKINQIAAEKPAYRSGGSAMDGTCDCIGLIIGALYRCGFAWTGTHGSNWAARYAVKDLRSITSVKELSPGDIVFKAYNPTDARYKLPARYKNHPDQRDYYHVGVVTQTNPLRITHCTTPTVRIDTKIGNWSFTAKLKYLSTEGGGGQTMRTMIVTCPEGETVRMRKAASSSADTIIRIPNKTLVMAAPSTEPGWHTVEYNGLGGYMMSKFLQDYEPADTITIPIEQIDNLIQKTNDLLKLLADIRKGGEP